MAARGAIGKKRNQAAGSAVPVHGDPCARRGGLGGKGRRRDNKKRFP